jgi:triacylglycerol lipase
MSASWSDMERRTVEMSFISLAGFWHTDPSRVADAVVELMSTMHPRQEIIWGPAVHQPAPERPGMAAKLSDALALICRDLDTGEHYIVFRGTNTISPIEWLFQDFMVQKQLPWRGILDGPAPEEALVSEGTATAIALRRDLRPGPGATGAGVSLAEALVAILEGSAGPCVMHFTGHSLGGLLASAMALWLLDYLEGSGRGETAKRLKLDAYGYAAPTAGNRAFADYLSSRLPNNVRYANDLDIATLAWDESAMAEIPSLYEPKIKMQSFTKSLFGICMMLCEGKSYAQPGERVLVPASIMPARGNLFLLEAAYQHCMPYLDMLPPERKETIRREILEPLTVLASFTGLKPVDLRKLFKPRRGG